MIIHERIVQLDVRPYLRKKLEPFKLIMDTVARLEAHDVLMLHAPFKPAPLFGALKVKGFAHREEEIEQGYWIVVFARGNEAKAYMSQLPLSEFRRMEEEEGTGHESEADRA